MHSPLLNFFSKEIRNIFFFECVKSTFFGRYSGVIIQGKRLWVLVSGALSWGAVVQRGLFNIKCSKDESLEGTLSVANIMGEVNYLGLPFLL